jgi:hypothetical protein
LEDGKLGKEAVVAKLQHSGTQGLVWLKKPDAREVHWKMLCHARLATALAAVEGPEGDGRIFCVTNDAKLWCRELGAGEGPWTTVATGCGATTLAAVQVPDAGPMLYATTADNLVYARPAIPGQAYWQQVGDAVGVVALAALEAPGEGPKLYCATADSLLYQRDAVGPKTSWELIGDAAQVSGLAAVNLPDEGPHLFCATTSDLLYRRSLQTPGAAWEPVGQAVNVVALAAVRGQLLCVTTGARTLLPPLPHHVFLPVRKKVAITAAARSQEPRRITIRDEFGNCLGSWVGERDWQVEPHPYFAEQGSTPGVVVLEVLTERQYEGDPAWYGMRCTVSHQRGGPGSPEELTVAGEDCSVKFSWSK